MQLYFEKLMEVFFMAKKNQYGFRNEVIKNFTAEQISELIRQKKYLEGVEAEAAYRSLMDLFKGWQYYAMSMGFEKNTMWLFTEEIARIRQQKQDGFLGYSMSEKVGGEIASNLTKQVGTVLASTLIYFMIKYIFEEKPENKFTRQVMVNLTRYKAWEEDDEKKSYVTRNFYGKAMAIYQDEEFVLFLEDEFGIKDSAYDDSCKEFVASWAKMYLYLDEMSQNEPEKLKGLIPPKKSNPSGQESDCSQEEAEDENIETLFKRLISKQNELADANSEADEAEKEYAQAEGDVEKLEKKIEELNSLLQSARQHRDKAKSRREEVKRKVDIICADYKNAQQIFSKKYKMQFEE